MTEYRFHSVDQTAPVSTYEFHEHRDRAPHLEQGPHRTRLYRTAALVRSLDPASVVDLGCGDGGLLSLLSGFDAWGYDFQPSNVAGWVERGVTAELRDVFNTRDVPRWGEVAVLTEVLEHVDDPHGVVEWVARNTRWVVASSPVGETPDAHADEHAWGWDIAGYLALFAPHFEAVTHETVDWSQILVVRSRYR